MPEQANLDTVISGIADLHDGFLAQWYAAKPEAEPEPGADLHTIVVAQHFCNFSLWNLEDEARRTDVDNDYIADTKRAIDRRNQLRNDRIEKVDEFLLGQVLVPASSSAVQHSETAGMIVDRLSILSLKVHHMGINAARTDDAALAAECAGKLEVLSQQRRDLAGCLAVLLADCEAGKRFFKVYRQFKAYNDERLNPALYKRSK